MRHGARGGGFIAAVASRSRRLAALGVALSLIPIGLALALAPASARAQFSASISAVSDYRYRGVSLTDGEPALQLGAVYDTQPGVYVGGFASNVQVANQGMRNLQAIGFAGYAYRIDPALSVEIGVDYATFTHATLYDYGEIYVGATWERASARAFYSSRYYGFASGAGYVEINASTPAFDRVSFYAHGGYLQWSHKPVYGAKRSLFDGRVGVNVDLDVVSLQASWVATDEANVAYPIVATRIRNGLVVSVTHAF